MGNQTIRDLRLTVRRMLVISPILLYCRHFPWNSAGRMISDTAEGFRTDVGTDA